ncbi:7 transmembrane receptor (rhodopsin family) domain-containing protein [Ditylenchus destructor]|uniref:7 transmembrane receptor (Rhodopsin family) domain-containing protein n=1 Tax=Ditylenchus destructor TaxID=166010 RepID=A0AAD4R892_9BILA|nr:7 transmembrane receptor (rhodopsin family) domain-containing protein [Ditylenchus destructor]
MNVSSGEASSVLFAVSTPPSAAHVPSTAPAGPSLGIRVTILAYCYILPAISVVGIIGNVMNLATLASRRLRAVSYMYLRALAVADLFCMIFVLLFVTGEVLHQSGIAVLNIHPWYGFYQAHLMLSLINWALATGVYVVLALSLERYISVVFPMHFRAWNSPQRAFKAILLAYVIPAIFYVPYAIARYSVGQKVAPDGRVIYMAIDSELSKTFGWQIYKWTREALLRFLPILVLSVLNFQIMLAFRRRQKMFARLTNRESTNTSKDDTLLYILGGIVVMFFMCNIPAAINLLFINETVKKRVDYQIFRAVANLMEITNHAAQFYIFCVCSTDYRVTFMQKFPLPCFRPCIDKRKFRSFLRRMPKESSVAQYPSLTNNNSTTAAHVHHGSMKSSYELKKRSMTATLECASGTRSCQDINEIAGEQDTVDIQLASGEEDLTSDESDILLHYGSGNMSKQSPISEGLNGTTYL